MKFDTNRFRSNYINSDGSSFSQTWAVNSEVGASLLFGQIFSKLHENEKNWTGAHPKF